MLATVMTGSSVFDRQVTSYMHRQPAVARPHTPTAEIACTLEQVPTIAIVDELEHLAGVVSRTDLVASIKQPSRVAADIMTRGVITVPSTATIRATAQAMAAHAIHHIYVTDDKMLLGVVGAMDITAAVRDARISAHLSTIMTSPSIMISTKTTLGAAIELLSRVRVSGLVVVDDDLPVGTFTHVEALAARDVPRSTTIEDVFEPAVLCLPATTPLHAAASQLVRSNTTRVLACAGREVVGVATTLDFVRYVAW